jgi:hypothetical protein
MNSFSPHADSGTRPAGVIEWTDKHQGRTTVVAIAAAVLAGVLLGILFSVASSGTESISLDRSGDHALATVARAEHAAAAAVTAAAGPESTTARHIVSTRSPARGGFAVGRAPGAGSGFIVIETGTRAPVRGGFSGRSLGTGN